MNGEAIIDLAPAAVQEDTSQIRREALRSNRIDPGFLYVTPRQAELWREVSLRHAPVHRDPEFRRIYEDAFARLTAEEKETEEIALIGLGCGTGQKEAQLYAHLRREGREISFSAIDVSRDLVREATGRLADSGAPDHRGLVCDLGRTDVWRAWLDDSRRTGRRIVTFFGLVPNFRPSQLGDIWRAALRPGDLLLASVHLAPVQEKDGGDLAAALKVVLPQYDNSETLAWLQAGLEVLDVATLVHSPAITMGEVEGIPAFVGSAQWKEAARPEPLRLFSSLRYTPELFAALLRREGLAGECRAITVCRQEAIWCIQRA